MGLVFVVIGIRCVLLILFTFVWEIRLLNKLGTMQDRYSQDRLLADYSFI